MPKPVTSTYFNLYVHAQFTPVVTVLFNIFLYTSFDTYLFQFKDVLNEELLKVLISIVDAKLFKTYHKQKAVCLCVH